MNPTNIVEISDSFHHCAGVCAFITLMLILVGALQIVYYWDEDFKKPFWKNMVKIGAGFCVSLSLFFLFSYLQKNERERLVSSHPYYFKCYLGEKKVLEAVTHEEPQFENGALRIVGEDGSIKLYSNYILKINK